MLAGGGDGQGIPTQRNAGWDVPRAVALVGDGCGDLADVLARARVPVRPAPIPTQDVEELAVRLCALPADTGVIFLTRVAPARAAAVRHAVREAGGATVVTDADTLTVTLTAAVLATIAHARRAPASSEVVVAGPTVLPDLCPLLMTAGVGDLSSWDTADASAFPLSRLAHHATAVVDLLGATSSAPSGSHVIRPDGRDHGLLPAAGLVAALVRHPNPRLDLDVLRACALALSALAPPGRSLPDRDDPRLTDAVASAVVRVLARRASSHSSRPPHTTT